MSIFRRHDNRINTFMHVHVCGQLILSNKGKIPNTTCFKKCNIALHKYILSAWFVASGSTYL